MRNLARRFPLLRQKALSTFKDEYESSGHSSLSFLKSLKLCYSKLSMSGQAGFSTTWLESIFLGIILLVILITFLWQQGIPMILTATSNTTALVAAGATTTQLGWISFIGMAVVIFVLVGVLVVAIRVAMGTSGGGGAGSTSGRHYRHRRR